MLAATSSHEFSQYNVEDFKMMPSQTSPQPNSGSTEVFGQGSAGAAPGSSSNGSTALDSSPAPNFSGDDEFDFHIPQSALEEHQQQQHQAGYHYHQHQQYQQQMYHHSMHQQQWQQHQYNAVPNGYQGYHHDQYGSAYGSYSNASMYQNPQPPNGSAPNGGMVNHNGSQAVGIGGPSPVGSHSNPSPHSHSEDGFIGNEDHARNNNILKRPSPNHGIHGGSGAAPALPPGGQGSVIGSMHSHHHLSHPHPHLHHHHHHPGPYGHQYHPHHIPQGIPVTKKPKVSKRKKKRDPNEPSKPVSAYALFFRDSQASIKVANPNAAFGDVSKIVASLWDALDPDSKAAYKKRTENAKKEYLKKLAAYRASLVSKGGDSGIGYGYYSYGEVMKNNGIHSSAAANSYLGQSSNSSLISTSGTVGVPATGAGSPGAVSAAGHPYGMSQPVPPRPPMQQGHQHPHQGSYMFHSMAMQNGGVLGSQQSHLSPTDHPRMHHSPAAVPPPPGGAPVSSAAGDMNGTQAAASTSSISISTSSISTNSSASPKNPSSLGSKHQSPHPVGPSKICSRPGCNNPVQRGPEGWNSDYCSNECVVGQCKEVYSSWSSNGSSTRTGAPPTASNNSPGGPLTSSLPYPGQQAPPLVKIEK